MSRAQPQPYHPPVGFSDEAFRTRRRWIVAAVLVIAVLAAGIAAWLVA